MKLAALVVGVTVAVACVPAMAADITIKMHSLTDKGVGPEIGTIRAVDTKKGLKLIPKLHGLTPGEHGFHLHGHPSCGAHGADKKMGPGLSAGGHWDPDNTGKHEGPEGKGHKGDLPFLIADDKGDVKKAVTAPRLTVADLWGHALMIHAGGDNYSDQPKALGGGGARVACGTIVKASGKPKMMKHDKMEKKEMMEKKG